jgi:phage baseplate assembly protein W
MADPLKTFDTSVRGKNNLAYDYRDVIGSSGDFRRLEGINVLINSIRNLLITPLGSYPFNPLYGSLLYKKVFEPLDSQSIQEIQYECKDRIMQFDSRVNLESVFVEPLKNNKGVTVSIKIKRGAESGEVKIDFTDLPEFGLE